MTQKNVYAAMPVYQDGIGNIVEVMKETETTYEKQCFATYKKHWAEAYGRNWGQAIRESERVVGKKNNHVVLLSEECCLIPVKIRKPRFSYDGANGYIWAEKIKTTEKYKEGTRIWMENGLPIISSTHLDTIEMDRIRAVALHNDYILKKNEFPILKKAEKVLEKILKDD